jgi:exodeoxyribonuclease V alpha subunit
MPVPRVAPRRSVSSPRMARPGETDPREEPSERLVGTLETVTYHDPTSLYSVLRLAPEPGTHVPTEGTLFAPGRVTAVGRAASPTEGTRVRLSGRWGRHATHGAQFEFVLLEVVPPTDEAGLVRYLSSKAFEGIGRTIAERIVERLGKEALEAIRKDPTTLEGVKGLRPEVASRLAKQLVEDAQLHATNGFLARHGLGPLTTQAVVARLGPACEEQIQANPFALMRVPTVGFATADKVALSLGLAVDDPRRLRAVLAHVLDKATQEGHVYLPLGRLLERAMALLSGSASRTAFLAALSELEGTRMLTLDRDALPSDTPPFAEDVPCYLPGLYDAEVSLARGIERLLTAGAAPLADERLLAEAEAAARITLHTHQRDAVLKLLASPVALLTGGPGVGKTTIVRLVANLAAAAGTDVLLASPTGRAAKRLTEATGRDASTIHRLLRYDAETGGFVHGREKPLAPALLVIDEVSMLDVALARRLVDAVQAPSRLVLVGDPDQLPAVGPGSVLADLLASGRVPTARLTQVFRQDERSLIVSNAHLVLEGREPRFPPRGVTDSDFYFFPVEEGGEAIAERLVDVVTRRIPQSFGIDWAEDVQVLAPMYKGPAGVDALNERLRAHLPTDVFDAASRFRKGDRVVQTRNDYEREVFNGDLGRVLRIDGDGTVFVRFSDKEVGYKRGDQADLQSAFAMTVHRSQGGEFPAVVFPLTMQHAHMLQRNLFYTAITRAKRLVVLVGERRALRAAVENAWQARRFSRLDERLRRQEPDSDL